MDDVIRIRKVTGSQGLYDVEIYFNGSNVNRRPMSLSNAKDYARGFNDALECLSYAPLKIETRHYARKDR